MDTKSCLMEFIGAFFLVFAMGMVTLTPGAGAIAPFVAGLTLLLMIKKGGRISGGHYNPAVTLACLIKGDIGSERAVYYFSFLLWHSLFRFFLSSRILYEKCLKTIFERERDFFLRLRTGEIGLSS